MRGSWRKRRVGLALGSGGARGWAHLGVLRVLEEAGVRVEYVAGTSMGAVVGAFWSAGRIAVLRELAEHLDWQRLRQFFWELSLSRSGLTDGRRLIEETERLLTVREFRTLSLPFRAVATDLHTGAEVVLSSGDLLQAIRASISIPGLFSPVWRDGRWLVDGGLVNPVPVNVAREMGARTVIAVDVAHGLESAGKPVAPPKKAIEPPNSWRPPKAADAEPGSALQMLEGFFDEVERKVRKVRASWEAREAKPDMVDILVRSVRIMEAQIARARRQAEPPDLLIEPAVGDIGTLDFQRAQEAIAAGEEAARRALA